MQLGGVGGWENAVFKSTSGDFLGVGRSCGALFQSFWVFRKSLDHLVSLILAVLGEPQMWEGLAIIFTNSKEYTHRSSQGKHELTYIGQDVHLWPGRGWSVPSWARAQAIYVQRTQVTCKVSTDSFSPRQGPSSCIHSLRVTVKGQFIDSQSC